MILQSYLTSPTRRPSCCRSWTISASLYSTRIRGVPCGVTTVRRGAQAIDDMGGRPDEGHGIVAHLPGHEGAGALGAAGLDGDAHTLQIIGDAGDRRATAREIRVRTNSTYFIVATPRG